MACALHVARESGSAGCGHGELNKGPWKVSASLAQEGKSELLSQGASLSGSEVDLCANFQEGKACDFIADLAVSGGGPRQVTALRCAQQVQMS